MHHADVPLQLFLLAEHLRADYHCVHIPSRLLVRRSGFSSGKRSAHICAVLGNRAMCCEALALAVCYTYYDEETAVLGGGARTLDTVSTVATARQV